MGLLLSLSDEGEGVPERALGGEMEGLLWGVCVWGGHCYSCKSLSGGTVLVTGHEEKGKGCSRRLRTGAGRKAGFRNVV